MPIEVIELSIRNEPLNDVLTWLPRDSKGEHYSELNGVDGLEHLICTHPKNFAILNAMVEMIENANERIFLCNWMLSHKKIESALVKAASRLNGRVHVLTTLETSVHSRYSGDEEALNDLSRLQELAGAGVYIRLHSEAHAKFMIADDELLITSANIRETSLETNIETGIRVSDTPTVHSFHAFFSYLWLQEAKQHIRPSKHDPRLGNPWSNSRAEPPVSEARASWTLGNRRMSLVKAMLDIIKSAKDSLRLSTYALSSLESGVGNQVLQELVKASNKGVSISILYHATSTAVGRPPRQHEEFGFNILANCSNVVMVGHPHLHAKHLIADSVNGLLFTANLDGSHGLNSGIEVGVNLTPESCKQLSTWHDDLLNSFPLELVKSPTPTELESRGGTKLVILPTATIFTNTKSFDRMKESFKGMELNPTILSGKTDRWIEPETKRDKKRAKPYEARVKAPVLKDGYISHTGVHLSQEGKQYTANVAQFNDKSLHHAHLQPGTYKISLGRPFTNDELLSIIESHLPAPENGIALKEILADLKNIVSQPKQELSFELSMNGLKDYISKNSNRGLLRSNQLQGDMLYPVLTEVEAAELLKEMLEESSFEEMQEFIDKSKKPHQFVISKKFVKRLKEILNPEED
jgi:phosphatidylserine/phosphatidylglycerophosphate/cardiolipin synthase-like enzyme